MADYIDDGTTSLFQSDWEDNGLLWVFISSLPIAGFVASCAIYRLCVYLCFNVPYKRHLRPSLVEEKIATAKLQRMRSPRLNAIGQPSAYWNSAEVEDRQRAQEAQEMEMLYMQMQQQQFTETQALQMRMSQMQMGQMQQQFLSVCATQSNLRMQQHMRTVSAQLKPQVTRSKDLLEIAAKKSEEDQNKLLAKLKEIDINYGETNSAASKPFTISHAFSHEKKPDRAGRGLTDIKPANAAGGQYEYEYYYDSDPPTLPQSSGLPGKQQPKNTSKLPNMVEQYEYYTDSDEPLTSSKNKTENLAQPPANAQMPPSRAAATPTTGLSSEVEPKRHLSLGPRSETRPFSVIGGEQETGRHGSKAEKPEIGLSTPSVDGSELVQNLSRARELVPKSRPLMDASRPKATKSTEKVKLQLEKVEQDETSLGRKKKVKKRTKQYSDETSLPSLSTVQHRSLRSPFSNKQPVEQEEIKEETTPAAFNDKNIYQGFIPAPDYMGLSVDQHIYGEQPVEHIYGRGMDMVYGQNMNVYGQVMDVTVYGQNMDAHVYGNQQECPPIDNHVYATGVYQHQDDPQEYQNLTVAKADAMKETYDSLPVKKSTKQNVKPGRTAYDPEAAYFDTLYLGSTFTQ